MIDVSNDIITPMITTNKAINPQVIDELIKGLFATNKTPKQYKVFNEYKAVFRCLVGLSDTSHILRSVLINRLQKKATSCRDFDKVVRAVSLTMLLLFPEGIQNYADDMNKRSHGDTNQREQYPYIPYNQSSFVSGLRSVPSFLKGSSFIDVGCGIGDKVFIASLLSKGLRCSGIEYDTSTHAIAQRKMFLNRDYNFICGNAFKLDFSKYDRIYTYQPMGNQSILLDLYKHIADTMPRNGMWFEANSNVWNTFIKDDGRFSILSKNTGYGYPDSDTAPPRIVRKYKN